MDEQLDQKAPRGLHVQPVNDAPASEGERAASPKEDDLLDFGGDDGFVPSATPVITMDGSALQRPQAIVGWRLVVLALLVIAACVIGYNVGTAAIDNVVYASDREQAAVNAQLARDSAVNLPAPSSFVGYSDADIRDNFKASGYVFFENEVSDGTTLEVVKLPSDVSLEVGKELYDTGLTKISASDAAKLLNGLWRFDVSRGDGTVMRLRDADFTSGSADAAVSKAMATLGLGEDSVAESGMDDSGNTYKTGTAEINGESVTWRVSVIALSEVYSINAMPATAMYVGVRFVY